VYGVGPIYTVTVVVVVVVVVVVMNILRDRRIPFYASLMKTHAVCSSLFVRRM
jgi:hypothetical protein